MKSKTSQRVHEPKPFEYGMKVAPSQKKQLRKYGMSVGAVNRLSRKEAMEILNRPNPRNHIKRRKAVRRIKFSSLEKNIKDTN